MKSKISSFCVCFGCLLLFAILLLLSLSLSLSLLLLLLFGVGLSFLLICWHMFDFFFFQKLSVLNDLIAGQFLYDTACSPLQFTHFLIFGFLHFLGGHNDCPQLTHISKFLHVCLACLSL